MKQCPPVPSPRCLGFLVQGLPLFLELVCDFVRLAFVLDQLFGEFSPQHIPPRGGRLMAHSKLIIRMDGTLSLLGNRVGVGFSPRPADHTTLRTRNAVKDWASKQLGTINIA